ncbi:hypothetical protein KP509_36G024900 [Ceratopteris richardii]|uniref:Uncharacterized protein n=1 Tax=Ceratopteris richardii TaxID=49495 RepID=A0A8T2QAF7_CERRI|nr:hypothetical protein KP509_36G024900 [Ceratopteris richardii]
MCRMERRRKVRTTVCALISFLGALAAALAIGAEVRHVKSSDVVIVGDDDCFYPSSPSWLLGLCAASCLLVSQVVATFCGGCICCCKRHHGGSKATRGTKATAASFLVFSWISFSNAFFLLLEGAAVNSQQQLEGQLGMIHSCYILKPGIFGAGAGLSLLTCGLALVYYTMATSTSFSSPSPALRIANHLSAHHLSDLHHVGSFNPDYSITSARLPYVSGLELPKPYDDY